MTTGLPLRNVPPCLNFKMTFMIHWELFQQETDTESSAGLRTKSNTVYNNVLDHVSASCPSIVYLRNPLAKQ